MKKNEKLIGKHILVGLTYLNSKGGIKKRIQFHGTITVLSKNTLHFERADGQGEFSIPFNGKLDAGDRDSVYKLKSTGEKVTGVDFISSWTINPPRKE